MAKPPVPPLQKSTVLQAMKRTRSNDDDGAVNKKKKLVDVRLGANQSETHHIVSSSKEDLPSRKKFEFLYDGSLGERTQRSFALERPRQILRWIATVLFVKLPKSVEIQCYWDAGSKQLYISSNKLSENKKIKTTVTAIMKERIVFDKSKYTAGRARRHAQKLLARAKYDEQQDIYDALESGNFIVPLFRYPANTKRKMIDLHAERRIRMVVGKDLDPNYLAGVKRPCLVCARALKIMSSSRPGPLWNSKPALEGYTLKEIINHAVANKVITHVTRDRYTGKLDTGHDTDSESGEDT